MIKKALVMLGITLLLFSVACGSNGGKTDAPAQAAEDYFYEAHLDAPVENVEVLSVDVSGDHATVKVKVTFGEGMGHMPDEKNYKVFLEQYGDEWDVSFTQ